ncbi:class I SAM-dependent methyltransferase [Amycolatopsis alkalitolerans]|uniref:Class I SAM-dependent methyltransferase n=1 Tax=Amycolatopsis alkalitolerans TaxID=2547244 RepID=A0A5C4LYA3_9PSEU|nr:class I SAM-dependent methyltransferase [Amycolatopsis alkalitolerans]TNC24123.1 class I SAM-dependent methyltransferase [Amycolatopsis alkalitolerans]
MTDASIQHQYATGASRAGIENALIAAGKDLHRLVPADLAPLEDFHTMGRLATSHLVGLTGLTPRTRVLDAGSGIGGTARYIADRCGCRVTTVDATEDYCGTARRLNHLVGLDDRISVHHGDVTALPFAGAAFGVVFTQHLHMNVADKSRLYREARRVLVGGGLLALWEITAGAPGELGYPLPCADHPRHSHLVTADALRGVIQDAGFAVQTWNDLTDQASATMHAMLASPPGALGLHAFVPNFTEKARNLSLALSDGRLRAIQGIARAGGS